MLAEAPERRHDDGPPGPASAHDPALPMQKGKTLTDTYILTREQRDDAPLLGPRWVIRHCSDAAAEPEYVAATGHRHPDGLTESTAQTWATRTLYGRQVRTVGWDRLTPDGEPPVYRARTGPWRDSWQVTEYRGQTGTWRALDGGAWHGPGCRRVRDLGEAVRIDGPLTPVKVLNLPGVIAELDIYRAVAGYQTGPEECFEQACDDYDEDADGPPPAEHCSHVEHHIATSGEAFRLTRVERELDALDAGDVDQVDLLDDFAALPDESRDQTLTRAIVARIREAAGREDDTL
jgi:hypothetical protein